MLHTDRLERLPQINEIDNPSNSVGVRKPKMETRRRSLRLEASWHSFFTALLFVFLLYSDTILANAHPSAKPRSYFVKTKNTHLHVRRCNILSNGPLHKLMDGICDHCHTMFSHINPNLRIDCRAGCFKSETFKSCLTIFSTYGSVLSPQASKQLLSHLDNQN